MNKALILFISAFSFFILSAQCHAHFGMVIPSSNHVTQDNKNLEFQLSFSHPFENVGMDLEKPKGFSIFYNGQQTELLSLLEPTTIMDHKGWKLSHTPKRPGVYQYLMEPTPYWEPGEDIFIIHYTKTIVGAYGGDVGWDEPTGAPVEIIPLTRPFGNYSGNSFTGQVLANGKALANSDVEIEFYNKEQAISSPSDYHITQVVKTDQNGVFTFTCPVAGWWGFSALTSADYTKKTATGEEKEVELGGVLWIYLDPMTTKGSN